MSRSLRQYITAQGANLRTGTMSPFPQALADLQLQIQQWNGSVAGFYGGHLLADVTGSTVVTVQGVTATGVPWQTDMRLDRITPLNVWRSLNAKGVKISRQEVEDSDVSLEIDTDDLYT